MYHAESLNTGFRTAGAAFADESLRTRISLRLRVVPFLRGGGGVRGGFTPPCKVLYCTRTRTHFLSDPWYSMGTVRRENRKPELSFR